MSIAAPASQGIGLDGMTKAQLLGMAAEMGIDGLGARDKKADIIAAIEGAQHDGQTIG